MTSLTPERLFALLPAVHRLRDAAHDSPVEALLRVAADQGSLVERDVLRLLDAWFIETCDEWVVPYLGDLLGVRGLHALRGSTAVSQRARVANTIGYRRRKGTATMLEQLARDTTGWPARATEYFPFMGWNQNVNHVRPGAAGTADLRHTDGLELLGTAFDTVTHTVDVRRIARARGLHNLPNVGLWLWRLQSYFVPDGTARPLATPGFFGFHPVAGQDRPLFHRPRTETEVTHLAEEVNVPGPLRRRPLYEELEARRVALSASRAPRAAWFCRERPVVRIFEQKLPADPLVEVPADEIRIYHLGAGASRPANTNEVGQPIRVGVDPVLGRLAWAEGVDVPHAIQVGFAYGFGGDLGGGPYDRRDSVAEALRSVEEPTWHVGVSRDGTAVGGEQVFTTLADAVVAWNAQPPGTVGVISVMDSHSYVGDLSITVPRDSLLLLVAADWPEVPKDGGGTQRVSGRLSPVAVRPHVRGDITVEGTGGPTSKRLGTLVLDGLLVEGRLTVASAQGGLGLLRVAHSTLVPVAGGLVVEGGNRRLVVHLERAITGPIVLPDTGPALRVAASIVDAGGSAALAINAVESHVDVQDATVLGRVEARRLDAGSSLFVGRAHAARRQEGCVRYCFLAAGSVTGRRYRCQPDLAVASAKAAAEEAGQTFEPVEDAAVRARVVPSFTAEDYGHPAYAQLAPTAPVELYGGAEDGAEMGAFRFLLQPQREANLRASLDEYLRFGLEAGLLFAT
jgi:hypothetical protein